MGRGQFMNLATKERRLIKAKLLFNKLKNPAINGQLIFSDKKNFSQDQKVNRKNTRYVCSDISEVYIIMNTKFPATVIVLRVVSNKDDMMLPQLLHQEAEDQS
jgi:hypothetical protein